MNKNNKIIKLYKNQEIQHIYHIHKIKIKQYGMTYFEILITIDSVP